MFERIRALFSPVERRSFFGDQSTVPSAGDPTGTLLNPWTAILLGGFGPTTAGICVTGETAMRCSAVYGAVKVLAESLAQLRCYIYRSLPGGGCEMANDHPVQMLLADAPNDWTGAAEFRLTLQTQLALFGNAYAYVNRSNGQVVELVQLDSRNVGVMLDPVTMQPTYTYMVDGKLIRSFDRTELLHIRGVGTKLYEGDSPISLAAEAIGLALVMEQYAAGLFGNGARPSGVLSTDQKLTKDTVDNLRDSFRTMFRGGANAGRTAILEQGMKFTPLQLNSVDTQFIEMRKFAVMEIARIFRVPLHMLADLERVTFSNAEAMGQQFISFCMMPILRLWQDALRVTLLTLEERKAGLYIEFQVDDLARADLLARFTAYSQAVNAGLLNPNEIRAMENRGPYDGGEIYTRPVNTAPIIDGKMAMPIAEQSNNPSDGIPNAGPIQPGANLVH